MNGSPEIAEAIEMIRESAAGIADKRDLGRIRALRYTKAGFDRSVWQDMCDMGWPALRVDEARGGVGLGLTAYCALAECLGAALAPEPLINAALCASLLDGEPLADLLSGKSLILAAWQNGRDAIEPLKDIRFVDGKISGSKAYVPMALGADAFLVIDPSRAWLVAANAPGVTLKSVELQDGGHVATVTLDGVAATEFSVDPAPALAEACLATSAYLLGMIDAALERTVDYLNTRVQFGKVIGSFQALQHRAVDLRLQLELTRASVEDAAWRWEESPATPDAYAAISRAKARATASCALVTRQAIQLHGGIGYTDEHDISLFLRKSMATGPQYGSQTAHSRRFAQLLPTL